MTDATGATGQPSTTDEPSRKRERDADAARRALLEAAEEAFARDGFDGARVDAIAEAAGYNKSLIFQYFDDKIGLYQAVVGRMKQTVEEELGRILAPYADGEPTPQRLRSFVEGAMRWSFDHYRAHPRHRAILIWETAEGWRTFNCIHIEQAGQERMRWHLVAADFLRRAQAAGIVRAELDADVLLANAMGMSLFYLASLPRFRLMFPQADVSSPAALDRAREQLVGLILHGTMTPTALAATGEGRPARDGYTHTDTNTDTSDSPKSHKEAPNAGGL
jgi:TetR/AcrR family transcriptional regulator